MRPIRWSHAPWSALVLCLFVLVACDSEDDPVEPTPNEPPDTQVTAETVGDANYRVRFAWEGTDTDGEVVAFEWRLSRNGADQMVSLGDTLDVPWIRTTASDTTLTLEADLPDPPTDVADTSLFWQSYTVFVRAIDDDGAIDPSPVMTSVTATTVAPEVQVDLGIALGATCVEFDGDVPVSVQVVDPDGGADAEVWIRSVVIGLAGEACIDETAYLQAVPPLVDETVEGWSEWTQVVDDTAPAFVVTDYGTGPRLLAVQARDAAGAVTPTFVWNENVVHFRAEPPNQAPDTSVDTARSEERSYEFTITWAGNDADGEVDAFEWRTIALEADRSTPAVDTTAIAWTRVTEAGTTVKLRADLPDPPKELFENFLRYGTWRPHRIEVRAIDDDGAADPTPATAVVDAATVGAIASVPGPFPPPETCMDAPTRLEFDVAVIDVDGAPDAPVRFRWARLELDRCVTRTEYESADPPVFDPAALAWSEWIETSIEFRVPLVVDGAEGVPSLFVFQAEDEVGGRSPVLSWPSQVVHVVPRASIRPEISARVTFDGIQLRSAVDLPSETNVLDVTTLAGAPLRIDWNPEPAVLYSGIEASRWGFGVDASDAEWIADWSADPTNLTTGDLLLDEGAHSIVFQTRNYAGNVTTLIHRIAVLGVPHRADQRPLLLVFDRDDQFAAERDEVRSRYQTLLSTVPGFHPLLDVIDASTPDASRLGLETYLQYRSIVWVGSASSQSYYATRYGPRSRTDLPWNPLEVYQRQAGNLLLIGPGIASQGVIPDDTELYYPLVLDTSLSAPQASGTVDLPDGREVNVGTLRTAYTAWCLETVDMVRPPQGVVGELTRPLRTQTCDAITFARVAPEYIDEYLPTPTTLPHLRPTANRTTLSGTPLVRASFEEAYNVGSLRSNVTVRLRDCQVPMFRMVARRDADELAAVRPEGAYTDPGYLLDPIDPPLVSDATCQTPDWVNSPLNGAPIAISSTAYTAVRRDGTLPTEDFLLGFDPLGFEVADVQRLFDWIVTRWGVR